MSADKSTLLKLRSSDGKIVETTKEVALQSGTLKACLEDLDVADDGVIPVTGCEGVELDKVIRFCTNHLKDDPVDPNAPLNTVVLTSADEEIVKCTDYVELFKLSKAAYYMDVQKLVNITCKKIAVQFLRGKTPDEIRTAFRVEEPFTSEEWNKAEKEYYEREKIKNAAKQAAEAAAAAAKPAE